MKPKTIQLVLTTSLLSKQHWGVRAQTDWFWIKIMCSNRATCLIVHCKHSAKRFTLKSTSSSCHRNIACSRHDMPETFGRITTTAHSYLQPVTECLCHIYFCRNHNPDLSYSWLSTGFLTRLIRRVSLVEQDANSIHFTHIHVYAHFRGWVQAFEWTVAGLN